MRKLVFSLSLIIPLLCSCKVNNTIWTNTNPGGDIIEKVTNRGGAIYYESKGKKTMLFSRNKYIDVIYLSVSNGQILSRKETKPVSDFLDINYNGEWNSIYDFFVDDRAGIAYLQNNITPLDGLVYTFDSKQYFHVASFTLDNNSETYAVLNGTEFTSPLLANYLSQEQMEIFRKYHLGRNYRKITIDRRGKVKLLDYTLYHYEDSHTKPTFYSVSPSGKTEEERTRDLIARYLSVAARKAEWNQFFDDAAFLDNDYVTEAARINEMQANRDFANGNYWYFIIDAKNIGSGYNGYAYEVYEYGGFQVLTNDYGFVDIRYPAKLIIEALVTSVSTNGIHYLRDAHLLGIERNYGIDTYNGIFLPGRRATRAR